MSDQQAKDDEATGSMCAQRTDIKVVGIGGSGCKIVQHLVEKGLSGAELMVMHTDAKAVRTSPVPKKLLLDLQIDSDAPADQSFYDSVVTSDECKASIKECLQGADLIIMTTVMAGGSGSGAAPIIADIAKETGAFTIAIVPIPFRFEAPKHKRFTALGLEEIVKHVDALVVVDDDKILDSLGTDISIPAAYAALSDLIFHAIKSIVASLTLNHVNGYDISDFRSILSAKGHAVVGHGVGQGDNLLADACQMALSSNQIAEGDLQRASGVLVFARISPRISSIAKAEQVLNAVNGCTNDETQCWFCFAYDEHLAEDQCEVTIFVAGL